jgi:hypothetical protein
MKRLTQCLLFAMAAFVVTDATLFAQAKPAQPPAAKPGAPAPQTTPPAAPARLSPPVRGEATIEVMKPVTKPVKDNMVVTTIKVRNASLGAIAGLKVQEFWYDKSGNPVTGGEDRCRTPLQPGQTYTFTLNTPYKKEMFQNNYTFTHANGKIKTKQVAKIE